MDSDSESSDDDSMDISKDDIMEFVERYVDVEEVKQWADDTNAVMNDL